LDFDDSDLSAEEMVELDRREKLVLEHPERLVSLEEVKAQLEARRHQHK